MRWSSRRCGPIRAGAPVATRLLQAPDPELPPPAQQDSGAQRGGARPPDYPRPRALLDQAEAEADQKSEQPAKNHHQFHTASRCPTHLAEALPTLVSRASPAPSAPLVRGNCRAKTNSGVASKKFPGIYCPALKKRSA